MNSPALFPAFEAPFVVLTFATDAHYLPYASVLLASLLKESRRETNYDIIILHPSLPEEGREKLTQQVAPYSNVSLRFLDVTPFFQGLSLKGHSHISTATYYRLKIPSLFRHYEKVLYLDIDMLACEDIAILYATPLGESPLGVVLDFTQQVWRAQEKRLFYESFKGTADAYLRDYLGLAHPELYFQAGCLLLNLRWMREQKSEEACLNLLASGRELHWMDQDVLNLVFNQEEITWLSPRWNFVLTEGVSQYLSPALAHEYEEAKKDPLLIHYASSAKPWQSKEGKFNLLWWERAEKTPFKEEIEERFKAFVSRPPSLKERMKVWLGEDTALGRLAREVRQILRRLKKA
jgi:lipopolysaccharide biosynthesis glycosyltransferase